MCDAIIEDTSCMEEGKQSALNEQENSNETANAITWMDKTPARVPNILDPDDRLMKRFQNALKAHLTRLDNRLFEEIDDIEASIKSITKEQETESLQLYYAQQEIAQQEDSIEKYQNTLTKIITLRETKDQHVNNTKELREEAYEKLIKENQKKDKLERDLQNLSSLQNQFAKWEKELANCLAVSKRICKKDAVLQQELINEKQEKDCIIFKLQEEIYKIEDEIEYLSKQIQVKLEGKNATSQLIADANADIDALHREHINWYNVWKTVVINIGKRDKAYNQLTEECEKVRESFTILQTETEKLKKETNKETENNEYFTSLHLRVEDDIHNVVRQITNGNEKLSDLESQLIKITKLGEQTLNEYNAAYAEYQQYINKEEQIDKDLAKLINLKTEQENLIFSKLKEKVMHDKTARYLNKLLLDSKQTIQEQELLLVQAENFYGKNLLETAKLNSTMTNEKLELQELLQKNVEKEKEINELQKEIKKLDVTIERRHTKIISLNKTIEQILASTGGEEINPLNIKIKTLEKSIQEAEQNNQQAQQFWLRQQGYMITLSQQRDAQLQELNLISKEIMIMEQKNLKLQYQLEKFNKEDANMNKIVNILYQKLSQLNAGLLAQKELKEELLDTNYTKKSEYAKCLEEAELNLIKLQNDLEDLRNEKVNLKEDLYAVQQESLSWEKKVEIVHETGKRLKDERSSGGDIALMKSEIHKMEMRLSHLRRVQEKLIQDMEFCVDRRDVILDKVLGKFKKNPKEQHNQKIVLSKRLDDQKQRIKQLEKETKQTESKIVQLEKQMKDMVDKLDEGRKAVKKIEDIIPDIEQKIMKMEMLKNHKLKCLVFKQRKVKMLQDIKFGRYKMLFKNEVTLNEELQNEQLLHTYLVHVMEQTNQDFPLLKNSIRKILLTLQIL